MCVYIYVYVLFLPKLSYRTLIPEDALEDAEVVRGFCYRQGIECTSSLRLGARKHVPWVSVRSRQAESMPAGMWGSRVAASSGELGARAQDGSVSRLMKRLCCLALFSAISRQPTCTCIHAACLHTHRYTHTYTQT